MKIGGHKLHVGIAEFADSSVNIQVRFWTETHQVFAARFAINKLLWDTLQANNVVIPFPQREVQLLNPS